jgi:hypothetical protein
MPDSPLAKQLAGLNYKPPVSQEENIQTIAIATTTITERLDAIKSALLSEVGRPINTIVGLLFKKFGYGEDIQQAYNNSHDPMVAQNLVFAEALTKQVKGLTIAVNSSGLGDIDRIFSLPEFLKEFTRLQSKASAGTLGADAQKYNNEVEALRNFAQSMYSSTGTISPQVKAIFDSLGYEVKSIDAQGKIQFGPVANAATQQVAEQPTTGPTAAAPAWTRNTIFNIFGSAATQQDPQTPYVKLNGSSRPVSPFVPAVNTPSPFSGFSKKYPPGG